MLTTWFLNTTYLELMSPMMPPFTPFMTPSSMYSWQPPLLPFSSLPPPIPPYACVTPQFAYWSTKLATLVALSLLPKPALWSYNDSAHATLGLLPISLRSMPTWQLITSNSPYLPFSLAFAEPSVNFGTMLNVLRLLLSRLVMQMLSSTKSFLMAYLRHSTLTWCSPPLPLPSKILLLLPIFSLAQIKLNKLPSLTSRPFTTTVTLLLSQSHGLLLLLLLTSTYAPSLNPSPSPNITKLAKLWWVMISIDHMHYGLHGLHVWLVRSCLIYVGFLVGFVDLTQSFCVKTTEYAQSEQVWT